MKNTKSIEIQKHKNQQRFANKIILKSIVVLSVLATACASITGGFSRGTAATMIQQSPQYSAPAAITIDIGWKLTNAGANANQISTDDTMEAAAIRARDDFMTRQPQIVVAEEMGYIKLYFEKGELEPPSHGNGFGRWTFRPRAEITDAGRKLWTDLNANINEEALPIAQRGEPEITGITDERSDMKQVNFNYKWQPNSFGKAFDPNTSEFNKLPQKLQEALRKNQQNIFGNGGNNIVNFSAVRQGTSHFKKFDDGWRLDKLYFM